MAVTGNWTLFYDWDSNGTYNSASMTVNVGGTFSTGSYTGQWIQVAGMFMFTINSSETTYAGNLASKSITGIMTTFTGSTGSFYMLQEGAPTSLTARTTTPQRDEAGK